MIPHQPPAREHYHFCLSAEPSFKHHWTLSEYCSLRRWVKFFLCLQTTLFRCCRCRPPSGTVSRILLVGWKQDSSRTTEHIMSRPADETKLLKKIKKTDTGVIIKTIFWEPQPYDTDLFFSLCECVMCTFWVLMCHWSATDVSPFTLAVACCDQSNDSCLSLALASPLSSHMVIIWLYPPPVSSEPPSTPKRKLICCCCTREEIQEVQTQVCHPTERNIEEKSQTEKALLNL